MKNCLSCEYKHLVNLLMMRVLVVIFMLFCTTVVYGQINRFSLHIVINEKVKVDSIRLSLYNFHSDEAFTWNPKNVENTYLIKNKKNQTCFLIKGEMRNLIQNTTLYLYFKDKSMGINFPLDTGENSIEIQDIDFENSLNTINKYCHFDNSTHKKLKFQIDNIRKDFYNKFGKSDLENPNYIYLNKENKARLFTSILDTIRANPNNLYSMLALYEIYFANRDRKDLDIFLKIYKSFNLTIQRSNLGQQFSSEINRQITTMNKVKRNSIAPNFMAFDEKNIEFTKQNFKGQPFLLAFGATWCGPCKENIPRLKEIQQTTGIKVLYFMIDANKSAWYKMIDEYNLRNFVNLMDHKRLNGRSQTEIDYNITAVPMYYLVDKEGKIVYNGTQNWDESLNEEVIINEIKKMEK